MNLEFFTLRTVEAQLWAEYKAEIDGFLDTGGIEGYGQRELYSAVGGGRPRAFLMRLPA